MLKKDKVISIINGKDLVGVYLKEKPEQLLLECSPEKADRLIKIWNDIKEKVYTHTPNTKGKGSTDLDKYAEELAGQTLEYFVRTDEDDPFDGDETEYLADRYLYHLNELMGNK